jgi:hypothetical protein
LKISSLNHVTTRDETLPVHHWLCGAVALNPNNAAPKEAEVLSKPFHLKDLASEVDRMIAA